MQINLPCLRVDTLWHIGTLDPTRRYERGPSMEGRLFSMSACPQAWRSIARCSGYLYETTIPVLLFDMHAFLFDPKFKGLRNQVEEFLVQHQLAQRAVVYDYCYYDDEMESECALRFMSHQEALDNADDPEQVRAQTLLIASPALVERHHLGSGVHDGLEYGVIEWVERLANDSIAGVYWNNDYDPVRYSAPRAGIFSPGTLGLRQTTHWPHDEVSLKAVFKAKPAVVRLSLSISGLEL